MGRWGQGIFENDGASDTLLKFLDLLALELETQIDADESRARAYPESSLAAAYMLLRLSADTGRANFCTCDARQWRDRTEQTLRRFGLKYRNGDDDLSYPAARAALKLFDDLQSRALEHRGECHCGGEWRQVFLTANK